MYKVSYHHKILEDLERISSAQKKVIKKAIEDKLTTEPQFFGKPLQFTLKGLRSMRVRDYRVVFELSKDEVFIILIEHRATVYKSIEKRV
jgi:mRNA interferase RelE/StbE